MNYVNEALVDADIILYVVEIGEKTSKSRFLRKASKTDVPVLVLINKIDQSDQETLEKAVSHWHELLPKAEILPISALKMQTLIY